MKTKVKRIIIQRPPFTERDTGKDWLGRGYWPCCWITHPEISKSPYVMAFRKIFTLNKNRKFRVHITGDERYVLFLDGIRVARGSERGDRRNWFYETYDFDLPKGEHVLVARVHVLGDKSPWAQMSVIPGFLFAPEGKFTTVLGTGIAKWEVKMLHGFEFKWPERFGWMSGTEQVVHGNQYDWDWERGDGTGWKEAVKLHPGNNGSYCNEVPLVHRLHPATLPGMMDKFRKIGKVLLVEGTGSKNTTLVRVDMNKNIKEEQRDWNNFLRGKPIRIPAHTQRRIIIDLENYYCLYPEFTTSQGKGSTIRICWAESLYNEPELKTKGQRNVVEGKYFWGFGDIFKPDGGSHRRFDTLWWRSGCYMEIQIQTQDTPLFLEQITFHEVRYPMKPESRFECSDSQLEGIIPLALRTLQVCSHETFFDCPHYEQLMYLGDSRLEALVTYMLTRDDRLPRKCMAMFNESRLPFGLTQSRYPSRITQVIPPFSLWWIGMVYDYALWKSNPEFIKRMLPGTRGVIDYFIGCMNQEGLIEAPNGWNFVDWVGHWQWGIPPNGDKGVNGILNWHLVYTLNLMIQLEQHYGDAELAKRYRRLSVGLTQKLVQHFWNTRKGIFADDLEKKYYSEHSQILALLSLQLPTKIRNIVSRKLFTATDTEKTTIYFTHYLFETCYQMNRMDIFYERMGLWMDILKKGFRTIYEAPEPTRSDCHAWSSHPIYHYYASVLGIRPSSFEFRSIEIRPQLGLLTHAKASLVHPNGMIHINLTQENGKIKGTVTLPPKLNGKYITPHKTILLHGGTQKV